jgi:hypothetical protein
MLRVGLISDTHGLLRPEALAYLEGSDHIVHAGDIGDPRILDALARIAPLTAVRGNNDHGDWAEKLPEEAVVEVGAVRVYVVHDLKTPHADPASLGARVVISGHSHQPSIAERGALLYVNPGSAGRRRFKLPIAAGELLVDGETVAAHLMQFDAPHTA